MSWRLGQRRQPVEADQGNKETSYFTLSTHLDPPETCFIRAFQVRLFQAQRMFPRKTKSAPKSLPKTRGTDQVHMCSPLA